jgi:hypothetical protein
MSCNITTIITKEQIAQTPKVTVTEYFVDTKNGNDHKNVFVCNTYDEAMKVARTLGNPIEVR